MSAEPPQTLAQAKRFLERFGIRLEAELSDVFEDVGDKPSRVLALNELFERAVSAESWYLDKAMDVGIKRVLRLLPGTGVVQKQILEFGALDKELPHCCAVEDSGLYGACTPSAIQRSADALARFQDPEAILSLAQRTATGIFGFVNRTPSKAREALKILEDPYLLAAWSDLCVAVQKCVSQQHFLGLGMSA